LIAKDSLQGHMAHPDDWKTQQEYACPFGSAGYGMTAAILLSLLLSLPPTM
jgi:hypothetical protein